MTSESTSSHGKGGTAGDKREPQPPPESSTLTDITGSTGSGSGMATRKDGGEAGNLGISQLTAVISKESDFAAD